MTNQTVEPPNKPSSAASMRASAAAASARASSSQDKPKTERPHRGSGVFLMISLLLIAAAFAVLVLSPGVLDQLLARFGDSTPQATIAVAPPPTPPAQPSTPTAQPETSRPAAPPPTAAANGAVIGELQALRDMLADVTARLGDMERKSAAGGDARASDLVSRLNAVESRLGALIEQPAVTPSMLTDALGETRQAAQATVEETAQRAAQEAAQSEVRQAFTKAQDESRRALDSALNDMRRNLEATRSEIASSMADLTKRTADLEKSAGAVAAIADLEKRVAGVEKMASAVAAIVDLERRTALLEKSATAVVAIPDLERRVAAMEKTTAPLAAQSRTALQGESLALGLLALRSALDRGTSYGEVLSTVRVAAAADDVLVAEVERLAPGAANGVPTLATLRARLRDFPREAPTVSAAPAAAAASAPSGAPPAERGFWAEIWHRLAATVTVRRLDDGGAPAAEASGSVGPGPLIDRALARLAADDLTGAVALLDDEATRRVMAEPQLAALDDWLRGARARLSAETAFANLSRRSLALYSVRPDQASRNAAPADASLQQ